MLKVIGSITMKGCTKSISAGTDIIPPCKYKVRNAHRCNLTLPTLGEGEAKHFRGQEQNSE